MTDPLEVPQSEAQPEKDPVLDRILSRREVLLKTSLQAAAETPADQNARVVALADKTRLPLNVVRDNLDFISKSVKIEQDDLPGIQQRHPELASWLSDPANAGIAHDDLETMRRLDDVARSLTAKPNQDTSGLLPDGFIFEGGRIVEPIGEGKYANIYDDLNQLDQELSRRSERGFFRSLDVERRAEELRSMAGPFANVVAGAAGRLAQYQSAIGTVDNSQNAADVSEASQSISPGIWGDIQRGVGGVLVDAPAMLAGAPLAVAAQSLTRISGASTFLRASLGAKWAGRAEGAIQTAAAVQPLAAVSGIDTAKEHGAVNGAITYLIETAVPGAFGRTGVERAIIPGAANVAADGWSGAARRLAMDSGLEASEEMVTELSHAIHEVASGINPNALDAGQLARRLTVAGILGGGVSAVFNAPAAIAGKFQGDLEEARRASAFGSQLDAAAEVLAEAKSNERSPERTQSLLNKIFGDDQANVLFQAEEWDAAWKSVGQDPAKKAEEFGVSDAYRQSKATGAEMPVPTGKVLAVPEAEGGKALRSKARRSPGAASAEDAAKLKDETAKQLEELAKQAQEATGPDQVKADVQYIEDDVVAQLVGADVEAGTAKRQAKVWGAFFRVMGKRTGKSARELYDSYQVTIQRKLPEALRAPSFDEMDAMLDRLRSNDIPSSEDAGSYQAARDIVDSLNKLRGALDAAGVDLGKADNKQAREALALMLEREEAAAAGASRADTKIMEQSGRTPEQGQQVYDDLVSQIPQEELALPVNRKGTTLAEALKQFDPQKDPDGVEGNVNQLRMNAADLSKRKPKTLYQGNVVSPRDKRLDFDAMLRQWNKAMGQPQPQKGQTWAELEAQSAAIDKERGIELEQPGRGVRRGSYNTENHTITLFQQANLSTFLHESGHFFLEVFGDLATKADVDPALAKDYASLLNWMGVDDRSKIGRDQHEQFARGFEAYLLEGKAPSSALRSAFARIKAWMVAIYRDIRRLDVELAADVRGVFDRLLATEEEIASAESRAGGVAAFQTAKDAGMTDEQFARYQEAVASSQQAARDILERQLMAEYNRESSEAWKSQRAEVRQQVAEDINSRPVYTAMLALQNGVMPSGQPLPGELANLKLSRDDLVAQYGEAALEFLPGPQRKDQVSKANRGRIIYSKDGGMLLQGAAEMFGFRSGSEFWDALVSAPDRVRLIESETDARMRELRPDPMTDGTAAERADEAIRNDRKGELMSLELAQLARKSGQPDVPRKVMQEVARETISRKVVRYLEPHLYEVAEQKAAKRVEQALIKGDFGSAFVAKQQQMLNHELVKESTKAVRQAEADGKYLLRMRESATRQRIGKAGGWTWTVFAPGHDPADFSTAESAEADAKSKPGSTWGQTSSYLDQIDSILARFELAPKTARTLNRRQSLQQFIAQQVERGAQVSIPPEVLQEAYAKNYRDMTVAEQRSVVDSVRNIENMARLKNKLLKSERSRSVESAVSAILAGVERHGPSQSIEKIEQGLFGKFTRGVGNFFASHKKLSTIARIMDGDQDGGPAWDALVRPANEAGVKETVMRAEATERMSQLFSEWEGSLTLNPYTRQYIPAIDQSLSRMGRVMVALNWGNAGNRERLMTGENWSEAQVGAVLDTLTKSDWKLVQGLWDQISSYWPSIAAKQQRVTGVAPEKVEAVPVVTKFGTFDGGYFPIAYDPRRSIRAENIDAAEQAKLVMGGFYGNASTRRGHVEARSGGTGRPLLLDFGVIPRHLNQVIHDLTHHEMLIDANRILTNADFVAGIEATYGPTIYRQVKDAFRDIAAGDIGASTTAEAWLAHLRAGASIASMGWSLTTAAVQVTGIGQSIVRVGAGYFGRAIGRLFRDPASIFTTESWVNEKSRFMKTRASTMMRELNEISNRIGFTGLKQKLDQTFWLFTTKMQRMVDVPTWIAAYEKAMDAGEPDARAVQIADQAVIDTQGSGMVKDLSAIQRGGPWQKLWTTFYSYFNTTFNLTATSLERTRWNNPASVAHLASDLLLLYSFPAVASMLIMDALKGGNDDDYKDVESLAKRVAKEHLGFMMGAVVFGREANGALNGFGWSGPGGARGFDAMNDLIREVSQGELDKGLTKAAMTSAGVFLHLPSAQAVRALDGYTYMQDNPQQDRGIMPILFGAPPKDR